MGGSSEEHKVRLNTEEGRQVVRGGPSTPPLGHNRKATLEPIFAPIPIGSSCKFTVNQLLAAKRYERIDQLAEIAKNLQDEPLCN